MGVWRVGAFWLGVSGVSISRVLVLFRKVGLKFVSLGIKFLLEESSLGIECFIEGSNSFSNFSFKCGLSFIFSFSKSLTKVLSGLFEGGSLSLSEGLEFGSLGSEGS